MNNLETNNLKKILLFSLINSSIFIAFQPGFFPRLLIAALMNTSGILLVISFFKYKRKTIDKVSYFNVLFTLLILWSLFTVFRSVSLNSVTMISLFGHYLMGWAWMAPMAIVFGFKIANWILLFDFFITLLKVGSIVALGSYFYSTATIFGIIEWMAFFPIILLTFNFQSKDNKNILIFSIFSYLMLSYFGSQRANIIFLSLFVSFFIIESFKEAKVSALKKFLTLFFMLIGLVIIAVQASSFIADMSNNKELMTDTRTFLFLEMFNDMSLSETIIGRGAMGTYFSPYFYMIEVLDMVSDSSTRSVNEVGYLQIILKGGYIMMGLYILILLPAAYLGIFRSKNIIAKSCGYFVLTYLIMWCVSYYIVYSAEYLLLWMATGTCISKSARNVKNDAMLIKIKEKVRFVKL